MPTKDKALFLAGQRNSSAGFHSSRLLHLRGAGSVADGRQTGPSDCVCCSHSVHLCSVGQNNVSV